MKPLLIGINAKFIHTNPAIRSISAFSKKQGLSLPFLEFTINQSKEYILKKIFEQNPHIIGFSCYIWNIDTIYPLVSTLKKILPTCSIFLGGPEVSYNPEMVLNSSKADFILCGEGEKSVYELISKFKNGKNFFDVPGLAFFKNSKFIQNECCDPINLSEIPFLYENFEKIENQIPYYESSRGCPFRCAYCLSAKETSMRFRDIDLVFLDMNRFLKANVRQVKFIDRSFNCDEKRAYAIWEYLIKNDNGVTNFHFEINAEILSEESIKLLSHARKGLFQFEIGVQTTNPKTLEAICRKDSFLKSKDTIKKLRQQNNIHLHLDLIAGLPFENFESFKKSFNDVFSLKPHQLQLGFLKMLYGSPLSECANSFELKWSNYPPYEILSTPDLSFGDILKLKLIENIVEIYYNSGRFTSSLSYVLEKFSCPFDAFSKIADFSDQSGIFEKPIRKDEYFQVLYDFLDSENLLDDKFDFLCKHDIYSNEKAKRIPSFLNKNLDDSTKQIIYTFYNNKQMISKYLPSYTDMPGTQIARIAHIEIFPFDPITWQHKKTAILYDYIERDFCGRAKTQNITSELSLE